MDVVERQWRLEACEHESKHAGLLHAYGVHVTRVGVCADGSGETTYNPLDDRDLADTLRWEPYRVAQRLVMVYMAGCYAGGIGTREPLCDGDARMLAHYGAVWTRVRGSDTCQPSAATLQAKARAMAHRWVIEHEEAITRFARQLDSAGSLSGSQLQQRLERVFGHRGVVHAV